jgi:hypothetical protein
MRLLVLSIALLASNSLRVCESSGEGAGETPAPTVEAKVTGKASAAAAIDGAIAAEIGGHLVAIGDHVVEVLVHRQGLVEATVRTSDGKVVSPATIEVAARLHATGGAKPQVKLSWDPLHARFRGRAGAGVELGLGPIEWMLTIDGKSLSAKLERTALLTGPDFGGQLVGTGEYGAEVLVDADGAVAAYARTAAGAEVNGGVDIEVDLATEGGASHTLQLAYSAPDAAFKGRAQAGVRVAPGPLKLTVRANGKAHVGGLGRVVLRAKAAHGGRVVVAGDYSVELVAEGPRLFAAYVFDASGKAVARADLDLHLAFGLDADKSLSFAWDPPSASYRAELQGKADFRVQPVQITLRADGRAHVGALASFAADAKVAAAANARVTARAPSASASVGAKAKQSATADARATATAPKVTVQKSASASAGTNTSGGTAKAGAKAGAGFSIGTK